MPPPWHRNFVNHGRSRRLRMVTKLRRSASAGRLSTRRRAWGCGTPIGGPSPRSARSGGSGRAPDGRRIRRWAPARTALGRDPETRPRGRSGGRSRAGRGPMVRGDGTVGRPRPGWRCVSAAGPAARSASAGGDVRCAVRSRRQAVGLVARRRGARGGVAGRDAAAGTCAAVQRAGRPAGRSGRAAPRFPWARPSLPGGAPGPAFASGVHPCSTRLPVDQIFLAGKYRSAWPPDEPPTGKDVCCAISAM